MFGRRRTNDRDNAAQHGPHEQDALSTAASDETERRAPQDEHRDTKRH